MSKLNLVRCLVLGTVIERPENDFLHIGSLVLQVGLVGIQLWQYIWYLRL